jgi:hypothetical protein
MELGFSVAAGPLSQISVSLFSVELAVQLATGAYGWWKVRERCHSLAQLAETKDARISATSTFNLLRYRHRRQDSLIRGVARSPDGILSCVTLPNASTATDGDAGMVCLRAVICALLCFYNTPTVLTILVDSLPGTLYHSNQDGGEETIEGPLLSSLREYIRSAEVEEDSDQLRQKLQEIVDSRLLNVTTATHKDLFECDENLESDVPNIVGALRWILTPEFKRKYRVYPTRSLKVWALAVIMAQLGFEVVSAMHVISSKKEYEDYIDNVGYQSTYQEVFLVIANNLPTDPGTFRGPPFHASPKPRIGSIRSIPRIAFRHLNNGSSVNTVLLCEVWDFTFNYVLSLLQPPSKINTKYAGLFEGEVLFTREALESFAEKSSYVPKNPRLTDSLQWLTFLVSDPLRKFMPSKFSQIEDIWVLTNSIGQFQGLTDNFVDLPKDDDADSWYVARVAVLATIYALCCKWLYQDDSMADLLDTEVAFCPYFIRRGNLAPWTSFECFRVKLFSDRQPSSWTGGWEFGTSMGPEKWLHLLYLVFAGGTESSEIKNRLSSASAGTNHLNTKILGFQKNGMVMIPDILIHPSTEPTSWFRYHLCVGQILDLPLDQDGFICHSNRFNNPHIGCSLPGTITKTVEIKPSDVLIRLDVEPWWEFDPTTVIFRVRVGGIVKGIFSPEALYEKNIYELDHVCKCPSINTSMIQLGKEVVVYSVSEYLSLKKEKHNYGSKPIFVQTGGDSTAQVVCISLSISQSARIRRGPVSCLNYFNNGDVIYDFYFL